MRSSNRIRVLGVLQLIVGLFLAIFIAGITLSLTPQLLRPGQPVDGGAKFNGTLQESMLILGLFGILITFGVASAFNGVWQIVTGRRNRWLIFAVLGLGIFLILVANVVYGVLK